MLDILSCSPKQFCRKCSLTIVSLLFLQVLFAQNNFNKADSWVKDNLHRLGGRATLIILKDGKIV